MAERFSRLKVGLALGGGAARGFAHLGVLKELEKADIQIDYIAGTSIGAAIGGVYALEPNAEETEKKALEFLNSQDFIGAKMDFLDSAKGEKRGFGGILNKVSRTFRKSFFYGISIANISFLPDYILERNLARLIPDVDFSECKIPFSCGATDLKSRNAVFFNEGPMRRAIAASCAIPGIFPPVEIDGMVLIDGSWAVQNPARRVREMGADFVIAVDITAEDDDKLELRNSVDVLVSGGIATRRVLATMQLEEADIVVCPDTCDIHWADFSEAPACIRRGDEDLEKVIPKIKQMIRKARLRKFFTGKNRRYTSAF